MLEREQNVRDVLEALGEYKCDAGMSVENVPEVVKINTGWVVGVVMSEEKEKSVAGQFTVK